MGHVHVYCMCTYVRSDMWLACTHMCVGHMLFRDFFTTACSVQCTMQHVLHVSGFTMWCCGCVHVWHILYGVFNYYHVPVCVCVCVCVCVFVCVGGVVCV